MWKVYRQTDEWMNEWWTTGDQKISLEPWAKNSSWEKILWLTYAMMKLIISRGNMQNTFTMGGKIRNAFNFSFKDQFY